jgi:cytoskeletal protein CcmA (bactofilin family)
MFGQNPGKEEPMAKEKEQAPPPTSREGVISIIGPGMRVVGDCETEGTLRIEGTVEGTVRAGKAIVVGKDGIVHGDVSTQDAVIGGRVTGTVTAESRLELQATCVIEGEIRARRVKLDEGGKVNGKVLMGELAQVPRTGQAPKPAAGPMHPHPPAPAQTGRQIPA